MRRIFEITFYWTAQDVRVYARFGFRPLQQTEINMEILGIHIPVPMR